MNSLLLIIFILVFSEINKLLLFSSNEDFSFLGIIFKVYLFFFYLVKKIKKKKTLFVNFILVM